MHPEYRKRGIGTTLIQKALEQLIAIGRKNNVLFIEIGYLCIPSKRFEVNEEIEVTFDDWKISAQEYENDTSVLLMKNDELRILRHISSYERSI